MWVFLVYIFFSQIFWEVFEVKHTIYFDWPNEKYMMYVTFAGSAS